MIFLSLAHSVESMRLTSIRMTPHIVCDQMIAIGCAVKVVFHGMEILPSVRCTALAHGERTGVAA